MNTLCPPRNYHDPEIYRQEQEKLFHRVWYFVGLTTDVAQPLDWIACDIGGTSVVIQNFDGELKALHNVCSHRFAQIRQGARGNGILQCPYHGWIYGANGCPSAIPSRPRFDGLDEKKIQSLALQNFQLDCCGKFLFVKIRRDEEVSLQDYLAEKWGTLLAMSEAMGPEFGQHEMVFNGNWKQCVENTLEAYHVDFIHPETLGRNRTKKIVLTLQGRHSTLQEEINPESWKEDKFGIKLLRIHEKRVLKWEDYRHQLIFPNLMIASLQGKNFLLHQAIPLDAGRCLFSTRFFQTAFTEISKFDSSLADIWVRNGIDFTARVLEEDRGVVESSFRGIQESDQPGQLSDEELRVGHFQKIYLEYAQ